MDSDVKLHCEQYNTLGIVKIVRLIKKETSMLWKFHYKINLGCNKIVYINDIFWYSNLSGVYFSFNWTESNRSLCLSKLLISQLDASYDDITEWAKRNSPWPSLGISCDYDDVLAGWKCRKMRPLEKIREDRLRWITGRKRDDPVVRFDREQSRQTGAYSLD